MTTAARNARRTRGNGSPSGRQLTSRPDGRVPDSAEDRESLPLGPALKALAHGRTTVDHRDSAALLLRLGPVAKQSEAMGLDESVFLMSTRDYILRSLDSLYLPIMIAAVAVLAWVLVHQRLAEMLRAGRHVAVVRRAAQLFALTAWWHFLWSAS